MAHQLIKSAPYYGYKFKNKRSHRRIAFNVKTHPYTLIHHNEKKLEIKYGVKSLDDQSYEEKDFFEFIKYITHKRRRQRQQIKKAAREESNN